MTRYIRALASDFGIDEASPKFGMFNNKFAILWRIQS
jgi:hypothetical protein